MGTPVRQLVLTLTLATGLVVTATQLPASADRTGDMLRQYDATKATILEARPHVDPPGTPVHGGAHNHDDPATKNSLSRSADAVSAVDPTSSAEKAAHAAYVARERALADPPLTTVRVMQPRTKVPARGAEAYLQMWERATGIAPDSCRNPDLRQPVSAVRSLVKPGMSVRAVMKAVGQPYTRIASRSTFCARTASDADVRMVVRYDERGHVAFVGRAGG